MGFLGLSSPHPFLLPYGKKVLEVWASVHLAGEKGSYVGSSALGSQDVETLGPLPASPPTLFPPEDLVHRVAAVCVSSHAAQTMCASIRR